MMRNLHTHSPTSTNSSFRGTLSTKLHSSQSISGRSSIMTYRNTQYPSASAALNAYIDDFENRNPSVKYRRTVEDLLSPKSLLQLTVQRSLETGVRDTKNEERRSDVKKMLDESYQQIMRADSELQKARDLVECSKHLSQSSVSSSSSHVPYLSPLPGSSVITDPLSEMTMSTDAMLQAPSYPPKQSRHLPGDKPLIGQSGRGISKGHNVSDSSGRDTHTDKYSTLRSSYNSVGSLRKNHLHDSTEAIISPHHTQNLYQNHASHNSSRFHHDESVSTLRHRMSSSTQGRNTSLNTSSLPQHKSSPTSHQQLGDDEVTRNGVRPETGLRHNKTGFGSSGGRPETSLGQHETSLGQHRNGLWQHGTGLGQYGTGLSSSGGRTETGVGQHETSLRQHGTGLVQHKTGLGPNGGRPPPSWIGELDMSRQSGRPAPSWIDDLNTSGRLAPSWVQDLDESGVTLCSSRLSGHDHKPTPRHKSLAQTLELNRPGNLRNLSPATELLISSRKTPTKSRNIEKSADLTMADLGYANTSQSERKYNSTTSTVQNRPYTDHRKRNVQHMNRSLDRHSLNSHQTQTYNNISQTQTHTDIVGVQHTEMTPATKQHKTKSGHNESYTTDDLVRISPTGRDYGIVKPTNKSPSHRYSMKRVARVAWDDNNVASSSARKRDGGRRGEKEICKDSMTDHYYTKDNSTTTDSLIYTSPRTGVLPNRQYDGRMTNSYDVYSHHKMGKRLVEHDDSGQSAIPVNKLKDSKTREKERTEELVHLTSVTPRSRLHSSPNRDSSSAMPRLRTSPIAAGVDYAKSFLTEDILEGDRSWERNIPSIKPPVHPVDERFLDDCVVSSTLNQESPPRLTNGKQPGPVEALKNMLFTLQQITPDDEDPAVIGKIQLTEASIPHDKMAESSSSVSAPTAPTSTSSSCSTLTTTDFDEAPGGKSLQRAMHHLSRLKSLVYDIEGNDHPK